MTVPLSTVIDEVISECVGLEIAADQSFFQAGMTSAHVVAVHARLVRVLGREFPVAAFFEHPTRNALVDHLTFDGAEDRTAVVGAAPAEWTPDSRRVLRARLRQRRR